MAGYTRQSSASISPGEEITAAPLNAEFNQLQSAFNASTGHAHDGTTGNGPQLSLTSAVTGILPQVNGGTGSNDGTISFTTITATTGFVGPQILSDDSTSQLILSGDTTSSTGANILLYGGTHATLANDFTIRDGSTNIIYYDSSANTTTFSADAVVIPDADITTLDVTGTSTLSVLNATGGGSLTGTWSDLGSVTTVDINGGTIDGATINNSIIGGTTAVAATFTDLTATGTIDFTSGTISDLGSVGTMDLNGGTIDSTAIGSTTPSTGAFSTLSATGAITAEANIIRGASTGNLIISGGTSTTLGANIFLRGESDANANDISFRASSDEVLRWDESEDQWETSKNLITGDGLVHTGNTLYRTVTDNAAAIYGGTLGDGAHLVLFGSTEATDGNRAYLDCLEFDVRSQDGLTRYFGLASTRAVVDVTFRLKASSTSSDLALTFDGDTNMGIFRVANDQMGFVSAGNHRMTFLDSGLRIGQNSTDQPGAAGNNTVGSILRASDGRVFANGSSGHHFGRTSDGTIIAFQSAGNTEGSVSISGSTTNYNSFCGSHWSQLKDQSRQEILTGTIVENINEKCDWNGERNDQLAKFKISDTFKSKAVYGVFLNWDEDRQFDDDGNDIYEGIEDAFIASLGAYVIRMAKETSPEIGDLIQSNGKGCGIVQDDDIFRSSTVAKITCTEIVETYEDGSYTIPCTLHCG